MINIQEIYKQVGKSSFAPGAKIQVTRLGGFALVDGHPVEYDVGDPPIPQGVPGIFSLAVQLPRLHYGISVCRRFSSPEFRERVAVAR